MSRPKPKTLLQHSNKKNYKMEEVLEAAAIGVENKKTGEQIKLFIVKATDEVTEDEIFEHLRKNLTNYKIPSSIEFRETLPKTNVGKILHRALREEIDSNKK